MKLNGNMALNGVSNELLLLSWGAATAGGNAGNHQKGVIKFNNGVKMQWDTISVTANDTDVVTLQSAYTADHFCVFSTFAEAVSDTGTQNDSMAWVSTTNRLTTLSLRNIAGTAQEVTYLSIGKDSLA